MTDTPRLDLPEISSGQSDKTVTHNDGLQILDILVQTAVIDKDDTAPPGSPSDGDLYIVAATATGAWAGHDTELAYYRSGWVFYAPFEGVRAWVSDEDLSYTWDGSAWVVAAAGGLVDGDYGDITVSSGGTVMTIDSNTITNAKMADNAIDTVEIVADAVTNAKLANMAQSTIKGRAVSAGTGDPTDLTATQATAILDAMVGDSGSGGTKGLAPAPSSGDAAAGKFLKADGTWAVPPGSGAGNWQLQWGPIVNEAPSSNFATLDTRNGHPVLDFDTTTQEAAIFTGVLPDDYAGGGLTVHVWCSLTSATTGTVGWLVSIERIDASSLDIDSDSFASAQTITATTVPGTSGHVLKMSVNISNGANMDSLAAGELFRIKIERDVTNDTATGDAELLRVMMVEQ
jgi:hypothetical protein